MADDRFLIVGLGNPGPKYARTRHNAGWQVVDLLAVRVGGRFANLRGLADVLEGRLAGRPVALAKPRSYMNDSGGPVAGAVRYYKVPVDRVVVVHDDLDLPFGALRLKRGGGDGGHNGLKSISTSLGSTDYVRIRFGIGRPPGRQDPADYVLREFTSGERKDVDVLLDRAADAVEAVLSDGLEAAQNSYNS